MCFLCIIITIKLIYLKIVYCIFLFKQRIEIFRCISAVNTGIYICGTGLCHAKIDDLTHLELIRKEDANVYTVESEGLCIESAKTVNEMTLNELVKLTTL